MSATHKYSLQLNKIGKGQNKYYQMNLVTPYPSSENQKAIDVIVTYVTFPLRFIHLMLYTKALIFWYFSVIIFIVVFNVWDLPRILFNSTQNRILNKEKNVKSFFKRVIIQS